MGWRRPLLVRVLAIGGATVVLLAGIVLLVLVLGGIGASPEHPLATPTASPGPAIASEGSQYRALLPVLEAVPGVVRRAGTHPRTLESGQRIRAYPGAPPRIPHGLSEEEFRLGTCNVCHARGGFAPRFGAYTPVTPHPELTDCLQCHVPDARTVGIPPGPPPIGDAMCLQCHVDPDASAPRFVETDWTPMAPPAIHRSAMPGSPPWIPHGLQFRENCVACHGGPGSAREIRTTHPERTDCRSCHVPDRAHPDGSFPPAWPPAGAAGASP